MSRYLTQRLRSPVPGKPAMEVACFGCKRREGLTTEKAYTTYSTTHLAKHQDSNEGIVLESNGWSTPLC